MVSGWGGQPAIYDPADTAADFRVAGVRAACDGAGAGGDDDPRIRQGVVGFDEGALHVAADRAGDEQSVRMAGRGDKLDAKASEIPSDGSEDIDIGLAGAAASGAHLPQAQGASEEAPQFFIEGTGKAQGCASVAASQFEVIPPGGGDPVVRGMGDCPRRACFDTEVAKEAFAEVEGHGLARRALDGFCRAHGNACGAIFGAACGVKGQRASVAVGQCGRGTVRVGNRFAAGAQAVEDGKIHLRGRSRSRTD